MGQYWQIVNVDKKQTMDDGAKLAESLGDDGGNLFRALSEVKRIPVTEIMDSLKTNYKRDHGLHGLGRFQLPVEIINMIFSEVEDLESVFSLAVTNTRLMIIGEKRLHQLMAIPSWRGDRIICIGDGTEDNDLPEGTSTQDYKDFLRDAPDICGVGAFVAWAGCSRSGFQRLDNELLRKHRNALSKDTTHRLWERRGPCHRSYHVYSGFIERLTGFEHVFKVPDILWNLTKKVYVRREAALEALEGKELADINVCGMMGIILQIQICWTSYNLTTTPDEALHRGKWAGDRFEFTDGTVLTSRLQQEEGVWKDTSEEVIGKFVDVLKTYYGEEWLGQTYRWRW